MELSEYMIKTIRRHITNIRMLKQYSTNLAVKVYIPIKPNDRFSKTKSN